MNILSGKLLLGNMVIDGVTFGLAQIHYQADGSIIFGCGTQGGNVARVKRGYSKWASGVSSLHLLADSTGYEIFIF